MLSLEATLSAWKSCCTYQTGHPSCFKLCSDKFLKQHISNFSVSSHLSFLVEKKSKHFSSWQSSYQSFCNDVRSTEWWLFLFNCYFRGFSFFIWGRMTPVVTSQTSRNKKKSRRCPPRARVQKIVFYAYSMLQNFPRSHSAKNNFAFLKQNPILGPGNVEMS